MSCKLFYLKKINQVVLSHTFVTFDIQKRGKKTYKLTLLSSKVLINPKKMIRQLKNYFEVHCVIYV